MIFKPIGKLASCSLLFCANWLVKVQRVDRTGGLLSASARRHGIAKQERSHTCGQRVSLAAATDGGARNSSVPGAHHVLDCVRLVLIWKNGVGKSATGNTILGKEEFNSSGLALSQQNCQQTLKAINLKRKTFLKGRKAINITKHQELNTAPAVRAKPRTKFLHEMAEHRGQRQESEERQKPETAETLLRFSTKLNKWLEREQNQTVDCVRLVLIGKTGVGKSATGNTILGKKEFKSSALMMSVTKTCKRKTAVIGSRQVQVIDTPGLFDTTVSHEKIREEIGKCITMSSPGPHVFLLLLTVGRFTQEERETVKMIQEIFGEYSKAYTIVGFTRGEELRDEGIDIKKYIEKSPPALQELMKDCSGRYHVFCNKDKDREAQVRSLLEKIDRMIQRNGGSFYTTAMFEETEERIKAREMRLLQQKLEELEQANTNEEVSFLVSEISKIKVTLEKKLRNLRGEAVKERDEDMKRLEEIRANLEKNHEKKIKEIDGKVFTELAKSRDSIRKRAEKAEAKAMAKSLQHIQQKCTIS